MENIIWSKPYSWRTGEKEYSIYLSWDWRNNCLRSKVIVNDSTGIELKVFTANLLIKEVD